MVCMANNKECVNMKDRTSIHASKALVKELESRCKKNQSYEDYIWELLGTGKKV